MYTKGEWVAKKTDAKNPQYEVQNATTEYPYTIADVYCEGDAYLIASAPDLCEALKALTEWYRARGFDRELPQYRNAEQLLLKAEGKA